MRLLTFQPEDLLIDVVQHGKAANCSGRYGRVKDMDSGFAMDDEHDPVYAFSTICGEVPCLKSVSMFWSYLMGYMQFHGKVMIELEVPESEICSMKDMAITKDSDLVYTSGYSELLRDYHNMDRHTYEVILPYIKLEWVVCYREWEDSGYESTLVSTVVFNDDLCPLWTKPVIVNGDGYLRETIDSDERLPFSAYMDYLPDKCYPELGAYDLTNYVNKEVVTRVMKDLGFEKLKEFKEFVKGQGYPIIRNIKTEDGRSVIL